MMLDLIAIGVGGAMGAIFRFLITLTTRSLIELENGFPLGTLIANLLGAFLMGCLFVLFERIDAPIGVKLFLTTGFLGALTTFSTFVLETVLLIRAGQTSVAITYLLISNLFGIALIWLGMQAGGLTTFD